MARQGTSHGPGELRRAKLSSTTNSFLMAARSWVTGSTLSEERLEPEAKGHTPELDPRPLDDSYQRWLGKLGRAIGSALVVLTVITGFCVCQLSAPSGSLQKAWFHAHTLEHVGRTGRRGLQTGSLVGPTI